MVARLAGAVGGSKIAATIRCNFTEIERHLTDVTRTARQSFRFCYKFFCVCLRTQEEVAHRRPLVRQAIVKRNVDPANRVQRHRTRLNDRRNRHRALRRERAVFEFRHVDLTRAAVALRHPITEHRVVAVGDHRPDSIHLVVQRKHLPTLAGNNAYRENLLVVEITQLAGVHRYEIAQLDVRDLLLINRRNQPAPPVPQYDHNLLRIPARHVPNH